MVVNVGDDEITYGLHVSPDLDTVIYTLAGIEGPEGWGRADDTWEVMGHLAALGVDTAFAIGDSDLATNLFRTLRLRQRETLSAIAADMAARFGVTTTVLAASDGQYGQIGTSDGEWLTFQDYFVHRNQRDEVSDLRFDGAASTPRPGVLEALAGADAVIVAPSNPPLSIWPILAIPGIEPAVAAVGRHRHLPVFGGEAHEGPGPSGPGRARLSPWQLRRDRGIRRVAHRSGDRPVGFRRGDHLAARRALDPRRRHPDRRCGRAERLARWLVSWWRDRSGDAVAGDGHTPGEAG